ncbi:MAG TPA: helix-turn-helix domain-containing protein [Iamia sp.]|nr:helix-turn-helix domain-containing protein [Iamia sp.]
MARPPSPPDASPALALVVLARIVGRSVDEALAGAGTSVREVGVLGHLSAAPGLTITELARRSGVTVQSMHALVADLVARDLVDRGAEPGRGRAAELTVTTGGRRLLARARRALAPVDRRLFADPALDVPAALGVRLGPPAPE